MDNVDRRKYLKNGVDFFIAAFLFLSLTGTLKLDMSPCPDEIKQVLTADLGKVEPYPEDKTKPIKEILEFPTHEVFSMATTYRYSAMT